MKSTRLFTIVICGVKPWFSCHRLNINSSLFNKSLLFNMIEEYSEWHSKLSKSCWTKSFIIKWFCFTVALDFTDIDLFNHQLTAGTSIWAIKNYKHLIDYSEIGCIPLSQMTWTRPFGRISFSMNIKKMACCFRLDASLLKDLEVLKVNLNIFLARLCLVFTTHSYKPRLLRFNRSILNNLVWAINEFFLCHLNSAFKSGS